MLRCPPCLARSAAVMPCLLHAARDAPCGTLVSGTKTARSHLAHAELDESTMPVCSRQHERSVAGLVAYVVYWMTGCLWPYVAQRNDCDVQRCPTHRLQGSAGGVIVSCAAGRQQWMFLGRVLGWGGVGVVRMWRCQGRRQGGSATVGGLQLLLCCVLSVQSVWCLTCH